MEIFHRASQSLIPAPFRHSLEPERELWVKWWRESPMLGVTRLTGTFAFVRHFIFFKVSRSSYKEVTEDALLSEKKQLA